MTDARSSPLLEDELDALETRSLRIQALPHGSSAQRVEKAELLHEAGERRRRAEALLAEESAAPPVVRERLDRLAAETVGAFREHQRLTDEANRLLAQLRRLEPRL